MSSKTKVHNIYLLDKQKINDSKASEDMLDIDAIMVHEQSYELQELKDNVDINGFDAYLFYKNEPTHNNRLVSFCKEFVREDQPILGLQTFIASSILFLQNEKYLFAITTGQGYRVVEKYCVPKFGFIVSSLFSSTFTLSALNSNSIASSIHSRRIVYSQRIGFKTYSDNISLDNISQEVIGRINDKEAVARLLGIEDGSKNSVKVTAKNYIQFSNALDFRGLLNLLSELCKYELSSDTDAFNIMQLLNPKYDKIQISRNDSELILKMYELISHSESFCFDIFNEKINDFIEGENYVISYKKNGKKIVLLDQEEIDLQFFFKNGYDSFLSLEEMDDSLEAFTKFIQESILESYKGDIILTSAPILKHISGELKVDGKNYYIFYGKYYFIDESYTQRIEALLRQKFSVKRYDNPVITDKWEHGDEDQYNKQISEKYKFIHLHKCKPNYIEFCDLLKVSDDGQIYIAHVKDGFDGNMRVLERQVELSIHMLLDLLFHNNDDFFKNLYTSARKTTDGLNISSVFPTYESFVDELRNHKLSDYKFIIVIHPPRENLLDCPSNIAKFCLVSLIEKCMAFGVDLYINIV